MVAGHLREKGGIYYIVLSYTDEYGIRRTPSQSTGLPVKGNKKRAEDLLQRARQEKEDELNERKQATSSGATVAPKVIELGQISSDGNLLRQAWHHQINAHHNFRVQFCPASTNQKSLYICLTD